MWIKWKLDVEISDGIVRELTIEKEENMLTRTWYETEFT